MEAETVKIVLMGAVLIGVAMLLWALVWYPLKAALYGELGEKEGLYEIVKAFRGWKSRRRLAKKMKELRASGRIPEFRIRSC